MEQENKQNKDIDNKSENLSVEKASYTYWKREHDDPFSQNFRPQKSDGEINVQSNANNFGSAWNTAGTW